MNKSKFKKDKKTSNFKKDVKTKYYFTENISLKKFALNFAKNQDELNKSIY